MESCSNVVFCNNGDSYKNTQSNKNLLTCAALWHTFALTLQYINEKHIINFSTSTMIKLSKIIKFKEGITRHKEEEFQKYSLKGWNVAGCSTQYIIVEKELQYDEAICLEGGNWPLIYVVEKDNSFGIIDEYGKEICPCQFVKYEYEYAWDDSKNPSSIILWTNIGDRHTYDRKTSKISILDKETLDVINKVQEEFWASVDDGSIGNEE